MSGSETSYKAKASAGSMLRVKVRKHYGLVGCKAISQVTSAPLGAALALWNSPWTPNSSIDFHAIFQHLVKRHFLN